MYRSENYLTNCLDESIKMLKLVWSYKYTMMFEQLTSHHLLECDLHQVFDSFIRVFLSGLSNEAVLQHMKHLLPGDVVVTVQVIHMKAV